MQNSILCLQHIPLKFFVAYNLFKWTHSHLNSDLKFIKKCNFLSNSYIFEFKTKKCDGYYLRPLST